jgi:hypothetical protein
MLVLSHPLSLIEAAPALIVAEHPERSMEGPLGRSVSGVRDVVLATKRISCGSGLVPYYSKHKLLPYFLTAPMIIPGDEP